MAKGRTASSLSLSERRDEASALFLKGLTVAEVARRLEVTWDTAKGYQRWFEDNLNAEATDNPQLLSNVLKNTIQMLHELDQVRAAAWRAYHGKHASPQTKLQALNTVRAATQDKAKLFGLFGVKQDVLVLVTNVKVVQDKLLQFMRDSLCEDDRAKLEHFLTSPELAQYMGMPELPALPYVDAESEEVYANAG
jgi:transposase